MVGFFFNMGRKKIEFTKEQDECITRMVNEGHSLNSILLTVNNTFQTNFSRSGIDRRIKTLGIVRSDNVAAITILNSKIAGKGEELREWKRKQSNNSGTITEKTIADAMGACVKTLKKMYTQFDIPQRLSPISRPDIYFDVKELVDCTGLKKSARDVIYGFILKHKPKDMRVECDVVVRTEPMTIKFNDEKWTVRTADMKGADLKVDFYFPDYKTGFYYNTNFYYKSICKFDTDSRTANLWSEYLRKFKNDIKLMTIVPLKSLENTYCDLEFAAQSMIDRAISGEYNHWKYVESLH